MIPICATTHPLNGKTGLNEPYDPILLATNFYLIYGIICTDSDIILVQATVSSKHDVKVTGLDAIRDGLPAGFRQARNWCLVFITSTEESAPALRN